MEWNFATAEYAAPTNADWVRLRWTKIGKLEISNFERCQNRQRTKVLIIEAQEVHVSFLSPDMTKV